MLLVVGFSSADGEYCRQVPCSWFRSTHTSSLEQDLHSKGC
jgi:hypothetical protein